METTAKTKNETTTRVFKTTCNPCGEPVEFEMLRGIGQWRTAVRGELSVALVETRESEGLALHGSRLLVSLVENVEYAICSTCCVRRERDRLNRREINAADGMPAKKGN